MCLVWQEHIVCTGNAPGADWAFARGGNKVDPTKVHLYLPWLGFEAKAIHQGNQITTLHGSNGSYAVAAQVHPAWDRLRDGQKKPLARNALLMSQVDYVIAWPSNKPGGGGTGHAMRCAALFSVPVFDISQHDWERLSLSDILGKRR
jgi:hypothetical protein